MTFREQFIHQKKSAQALFTWGAQTTPLALVAVRYPGTNWPTRVSIIGRTIVASAPEIWRAQGALVHHLCWVTSGAGK